MELNTDWRALPGHSTLAAALLLFVTVLCFLPGITPELSGDDFVHVYKNRRPFPLAFRVFAEADGREYRPLVRLSLALDNQIWGSRYRGFHFTNLLLHLATVLLVFKLAQNLVPGGMPPLIAAALFALHPVHSYSINAIMGRTDLLCAVFLAGASLAYTRGSLTGILLLFPFALLSKEVALAFPLLLLFWFFLSRQDLRRSRLLPMISAGLLAVLYLGIRLAFLAPAESDLAVYLQFSMTQVVRNVIFYGGALLVPAGQFELRGLVETQPAAALALALLGAGLVIVVIWSVRHALMTAPEIWLALGWTVAFLLPVLLLFQRRYLYIPSIGFCLVMGWLIDRPGKRAGVLIGAAAIVGCASITLAAAQTWREAAHLVGRNLEKLVPAVREHPSDRIFVANVPNGLGEAHLFTHDSLRFAIALRTGFLPRIVSLTRIQLGPGEAWQTAVEPSGVQTRITPGPASYFVFDAPEFLPKGGRFLPVGTEFDKGPFRIRVTANDSEGRVSELQVAWDSIPPGTQLLVIEPDSSSPATIIHPSRTVDPRSPAALESPGVAIQ